MNTVERKSITINGATYTITSEGEVYGAYGQPIKLRPDTCGYATFTAGRKGHRTRVSVHRLVAELFIPNPNNYQQVNHIDGNKENNCVCNLEWVTCSENNKHAYKMGLNKSHTKRKVNQYDKEGNFIKTWESIRDFLIKNNLSLKSSTISRCCKHKTKSAYGYKWEYFD